MRISKQREAEVPMFESEVVKLNMIPTQDRFGSFVSVHLAIVRDHRVSQRSEELLLFVLKICLILRGRVIELFGECGVNDCKKGNEQEVRPCENGAWNLSQKRRFGG
jgi:hypothetical protein